jgi:acetyl-CoA carboxylase carboxyl transferase subunit beta
MQEGTPAFLQMVPMSSAVLEHKRAGLPYLVYLRQPTTGGVMASWGSLGHLTFAEPGALLGFLGQRATEAITGEAIPQFVQSAENLLAHGLLDGVLGIHSLRKTLSGILSALAAVVPTSPLAGASPTEASRDIRDPWVVVESSRAPDRPGARELLAAATHVTELTLAGRGGAAYPLLVALVRVAHRPCVLLAQDRASQQAGVLLGPKDLRVARRAIRLADELRLPLVTVVDTPGAALSREAEEGGLAQEIAGCIADLLDLSTPSVSVLMGQGGGGAALALLPADRVIACEGAWLAPLPPEGASAILHRTPEHAPALARSQGITATDLFRQGQVDRLVPEAPFGPDRAGWEHAVLAAIGEELAQLSTLGVARPGRGDRFRTAEPLVSANA